MSSQEAINLLVTHPQRSPLDGEQLCALANIVTSLKNAVGANQTQRLAVYTAILRTLKAHVTPLPGVNVTFAEVQAARLQLLAEKLLAENKPFPPELNAAISQGLVSGFDPATGMRIPIEQQQASLTQQQTQERNRILRERQRLHALQTDFHRTRASIVEAGRQRLEEPTAEELLPWKERRLPLPTGRTHPVFRGLDLTTSMRERGRFLNTRTEPIMREIPQVLEDHRFGKERLPLREAALLETRMRHVKLLGLQNHMRKAIWAEHQNGAGDGRRGKGRGKTLKQLQREFEKVERARQRQIEMEEKDARRKRQAWINAMVEHLNKFRSYHRDVVKRGVRAVNKAALKYHEEVSKNASRAEREAERARIQKLKDDDEEGYLELVRKTKNARLLELLDQTDKYLKELGAVVKEERVRSGVVEYENHNGEKPGAKGNYYEIAHAIKEEVRTQSALLVGGTLKEYQLQGIQWMVSLYNNRLNGILADEMGLGKTIQTLALIAHLMEKKDNPGPYLIIVPLSTISNWEMEFARWAPAVQVVVFKGDAKTRRRLWENVIEKKSFNVCLVTYEYVVRGKNFLKRVEWQHLIIDEGHRIKNHESRLSSVLHTYYRSRNRLLLTGTPLQNSLTELWALLNFLLPNVFKSAESFESWFAAPFANMGGNNGVPAEQQTQLTEEESLLIIRRLHQVLRPFLLRRMKADVLRMGEQLPEKQEHILLCEMSAWQRYMYLKIVRSERLLFTDKHGRRRYDKLSNPAVQLRKCVNHPYLFFQDHANQIVDSPELWRASGKFDMLDSIITKCLRTGHRILIFNQMTKVVDLQERLLRYRGIPFCRLDGTTATDERKQMVNDFNSEGSEYDVFLLTTRAGGLGVNLQTADTVIIFDSDWNPSMDQQAQDRAHRIGQRKEVLVLRMITAKSIEEDVIERASFKRGLEKKIIRAGMFDEMSKDSERQAMLRELLRVEGPASDDEQEDGLPTEEEINRILARSEEEFEKFTEIDEERREEILPRLRLLAEEEIPEWATKVPKELLRKARTSGAGSWAGQYNNTDLSLLNEPKKRRAATANVTYSLDQLSDRQYIKLMERSEAGEELTISDAIREVSGNRRKRRRKVHVAEKNTDDDDEPQKQRESSTMSVEEAGTDTAASVDQLKESPTSDTMVATKTLNSDLKSFDDDLTEGGNVTGGEQSFAASAGEDMIIEDDDDDDDDDDDVVVDDDDDDDDATRDDKMEIHNEIAELGPSPSERAIPSDEDRDSSSSDEPIIPRRMPNDSRRNARAVAKDTADSKQQRRPKPRRTSQTPAKRRRRRSISHSDSDSPPRTTSSRDPVVNTGISKRSRVGDLANEGIGMDITTDSRDDVRIPRIKLSKPAPEPSENGEIVENEAEDGEIREEGELSDEPPLPQLATKPRLAMPTMLSSVRIGGPGLGIRSSVANNISGKPPKASNGPYIRSSNVLVTGERPPPVGTHISSGSKGPPIPSAPIGPPIPSAPAGPLIPSAPAGPLPPSVPKSTPIPTMPKSTPVAVPSVTKSTLIASTPKESGEIAEDEGEEGEIEEDGEIVE